MYETKNLSEFVKLNHLEVVKIIRSRTGINAAKEDIEDLSQAIYLKLAKHKTLKKYNKNKGTFNRFLYTHICWHLSNEKARKKALKRIPQTVCMEKINEVEIENAPATECRLREHLLFNSVKNIKSKGIREDCLAYIKYITTE